MAVDRGIVDLQLQALGESARWEERELRDLPAVLHAGEQVLALARGKIARVRWLRRSWLIVVTQNRLLCLRSAAGGGWRQLEVSADQITRVALRVGPFRGRVVLVAGGRKYRLLVPRADAYALRGALVSQLRPQPEALTRFAPARMMQRLMDHVLALPAAALGPMAGAGVQVARLEAPLLEERVQSLEQQVADLRQQLDFIEQLLHERHAAAAAAARSATDARRPGEGTG
jgi:hypothetical protein